MTLACSSLIKLTEKSLSLEECIVCYNKQQKPKLLILAEPHNNSFKLATIDSFQLKCVFMYLHRYIYIGGFIYRYTYIYMYKCAYTCITTLNIAPFRYPSESLLKVTSVFRDKQQMYSCFLTYNRIHACIVI